MRISGLILSLMTVFSTSGYAAPAINQSAKNSCAQVADAIIRKTIENMGHGKDDYNFEIEDTKQVGKSYDGAPIMTYSTAMIISADGYFPGASAEVTLVIRDNACSISKVSVDLNSTLPE